MSTTEPADVLAGDDVAARVVRGGTLRVVGFAIVNVLGVVSSLVLLRHLGVSDFGRYGTVIALVGIASGISDAGLNLTGSRELALLPAGERSRVLGALLGARLALSMVAVAGAVAFAALAGYEAVLVAGTVLAGIGAVLVNAQSTMTLPLLVELKNGLLSLSEIVRQVVLVVGVVLGAAVGAGLSAFFVVQLAVGVGAVLAVPFLVPRAQLAWPRFSRSAWGQLVVTALPVALASVLTALYMRMLVVLCSQLTTDYQTGLFVTSARIVEIVGGLAMLLIGMILPVASVAARDNRARLHYVVEHTTKLSLLTGALLAVTMVIGARPIVVILGGEEFAGAADVLRIQAPVVMTIFLIYPWTAFLIADGRRRDLVRCMLIGTTALLTAGAVLIPLLDAEGAALAALVADLLLATVTCLAVRRLAEGSIGLAPGYLARFALALGVAAGAGAALLAVGPALVAAIAAAAVFAGIALALRLVPQELTSLMPRR